MKKWLLVVMVVSLLAMPALACGFPFPAGSSMLAVSKAVCAADETAESCQVRQDAYQLMSKLQTAQVTDMVVAMYIDDGSAVTEMEATGSYDYVVTDSAEGIGANIHATLVDGTVNAEGGVQSLNDVQFIMLDDVGYTLEDGAWTYEELDENTLFGLGILLGLTGPMGVGFDLYGSPGVFTVETGADEVLDGQTVHVQTLTLDLTALLGDADALTTLFDSSGEAMSAMGLDLSEIGSPSDIAMLSMMFIPAFEGSEFHTTLYIGADDGYIHRVEETIIFMMDTSAVPFTDEADAQRMEMSYSLVGNITAHNDALVITAPEGAQEGDGLLSGGGLGESLFGN